MEQPEVLHFLDSPVMAVINLGTSSVSKRTASCHGGAPAVVLSLDVLRVVYTGLILQ